ncbi:perlucin-like protein [Patiria miniata]|uniref:C-type lectin domain-containing protein n=1 Tax=Patiria miniata TaxID=46514 RepID=A0A913ZZC5_PATMI|nr:perlucin-like protein [Patiria miniata]
MMNRVLIFSVLMAALCALASAGCPEGYTQRDWPDQHGNCYKLFKNAALWFHADHFCRADGGWLATIRDEGDSAFVNSFFISNRGYSCHDWYWVGGTDALNEGTWRWQQDGSVANYVNWGAGEPNNYGPGDEDGLIVNSATRQWNDDRIFGTGAPAVCFVCEMYPTERQCSIVS